jgi:hypothetical protein
VPTFYQRLFTDGRPMKFIMAVGAVVLCVVTVWILAPTLTLSVWSVARFAGLLVVAACLGAMLGAFPCGMFLGIILNSVEARNGAPFQQGDEVVILSKRFPGRVTRVYEVWPTRHQVRVELGEDERREVTDVFSYTDVCRRREPTAKR